MFKNWDWEDRWLALLWFGVGSAISIALVCLVAKKPTIRYSLGNNDGHLLIVREIEWCDDNQIELDRSITYWEAIRMVDSLNKTLK